MDTEKYNKGLATTFYIVDGKFLLTGGQGKVNDNIKFVFYFLGWFRIFSQDFVPPLLKLVQSLTSYVNKYKNLYRYKMLVIFNKYIENATVESIDFPVDLKDRKILVVEIQYRYKLSTKNDIVAVRFKKEI
jgi:hypothetical protein